MLFLRSELECWRTADVCQRSQREAVLFSVGANGKHGMPPNAADKRKAVMLLLADAEWSAWSDREIARQCHVSHPTVASHRASLVNFSSVESPQRTYSTKHGTEAKMNTAGQKTAAAKKAAKAKPAETTTATPRERDDAPSAATVTTA